MKLCLYSFQNFSKTFSVAEAQKLDSAVFETAWTNEQWQSWIALENNCYYLVEDQSQRLGFLAVTNIPQENLYEIIRIGVLPKQRTKDVAFSIIQDWLSKLEHGSRILLEVSENNIAALRLYKKLGFEKISERKKYYADGSTALVMEKIL